MKQKKPAITKSEYKMAKKNQIILVYLWFQILGIKKYKSPPELLDDNINEFVNCYKSFFKNQNHQLNLLSIAYEDLYQNPDLILRIIISWQLF